MDFKKGQGTLMNQIVLTDPHAILDILIDKGSKSLSGEDYATILERQAEMLKPHLKNMPLKSLGSLELSRLESCLQNYALPCVGMPRGLDTMGIWGEELKIDSLESSVWGLSREKKWLSATIKFDAYPPRVSSSGEQVFIGPAIFKPVHIKLTPCSTQDLIKRWPFHRIWEKLGDAIDEWENFRQRKLDEATAVKQRYRQDTFLLSRSQPLFV